MIEGIDIFEPRPNGLPDFTKISPAQIFNGSIAASLQSMKDNDPYGLNDKPVGYEGTPEAINKQTTIDSTTGKRVEVRRARVVEELLNDGAPAARGHRPVAARRRSSSGGGYTVPEYNVGEPLPEAPETPPDASLLNVPQEWRPPMLLPEEQPEGPYSPLLPPPLPEEEKKTALNRLPVMLLEELKNLGYKV